MQNNNLIISVDGGALTPTENKQFGNYVFATQLLKAIATFEKKNKYILYLQEPNSLEFSENIVPKVLKPRRGWLKLRVSFEELISPKAIFLALNQALPITSPALKIAFCHGLAALYFPELYPDSALKLKRQVKIMLRKADYLVVSSEKVKTQLIDLFHLQLAAAKKIVVLPYGVSLDNQQPKRFKKKKVLLAVASNHPIKNHAFLIECFLKLIEDPKYRQYKLLLVGVEKSDLSGNWQNHPSLIPIGHQPHSALNKFYQEAECLLTTSRYESFNFPVLEALTNGTQVLGIETAIIPELKPFVTTVPLSKQRFLNALKKALSKPRTINQKKLATIFSWENYVLKLRKLYAQKN